MMCKKNNEYNCVVKHFQKNDILIYNLIAKFGTVELKLRRNYFSALVTSIISQQLSVHSARAIIKRFSEHFGRELTPENIISSDFQSLRDLGLSNAKAKYVIDLSYKLLSGEIKLNGISKLSESEIMNELIKVKGIGPWTVHMFLIFVLGKPNILPEGDLGIKKAIMLNYNLENLPTGEEVIKLSKIKNWAPYNTYASLYLWKSIDGK
jgi:DNA-3-methyladenine glycosylase II